MASLVRPLVMASRYLPKTMNPVSIAADSKKVACPPPKPASGQIVLIEAMRKEAPIPVA
jgi:hypothetical protein